MTTPTVVPLQGSSRTWRRRASMAGAVLVGLAALGFAALLPAYIGGMNLLMHPPCPASVRASLIGLGVAATVIAYAAIHLARRAVIADASQPLAIARRLWIGAWALWIGTVFYTAYVASHTSWSGVFDDWCHL